MIGRKAPLVVGSLLIVGLVAFISLYRSSPGELAQAHAKVAGSSLITDCRKCHAPEGLTSGCLQCHSEIKAQLDRKVGYHNYLASQKKTDCGPCHSDHNGAPFELVNKVSWDNKDPKTFTHPQADYHLSGKHVTLACEKCHAPKNHPAFSLPKFPKMLRPRTYLNLSQNCSSCHQDIHAQGLATACAACHTQTAWKPTPPLFNHDTFFPLTGGHAGLKCAQCHLPPTHKPLHPDPLKYPFERVKGKTCMECHKNPHVTRWVESCQSCHKASDRTWGLADSRMTRKQHAMTGFRLNAPHDKTRCVDCHGPELPGIPYREKFPNPHSTGYKRFEKSCEACHQDEHRGQFSKSHTRCIDCHSRTAFKPPVYGVRDHRTYPLLGGHLTAACNACHVKERSKPRQFVPTPKTCSACHKDIHYGQFRKPDGSTLCENCHRSTYSWKKLLFNHNTQSSFKLDKAHEKVACKDCHPRVTVRGVSLIQYKPLRMKCRDCHDFDR